MEKIYKQYRVIGTVLLLVLVLMLLPSQDDSHAAFDNSLHDDFSLWNDPFLEGVRVRFLLMEGNRQFHLKTTPVDNMQIFLQSMDSFYLCEETWMKEMKFCVASLKEQYRLHKNSLDPQVQEMLEVQRVLIEKLDILIRNADSANAEALEEAFYEYVNTYERLNKEGGALYDGEKKD